MELNKVLGDIKPVVATEDITEGRMVVLTSHVYDNNFGSLADLPGIKLPGTADEGKRARFIVSWAVDNRRPPYFNPMPSYAWALRNGFGSAANVPFTATVWLTYPGYQNGVTIPSGTACLAYGAGTYTVPSGSYVYNASLVPGAPLSVAYADPNKGKLQYQATWDADLVVATVDRLDSATMELTFTVKEF